MSRATEHSRRAVTLGAAVAAGLLLLAGSIGRAQPVGREGSEPDPAAELDGYLDRPGLRALLADHLHARLHAARPEERTELAERLGRLYVEFIGAAKSIPERQSWEERARELLSLVPEVKSYELRLDLARTVYNRSEAVAERRRLRLATDEEAADAERSLRELKQQFESIGSEANRRVESLERAEESGRAPEKTAEAVAEARRVRSIAYYYAGWSSYYLSFLSGADAPAVDAQKNFGWILGAAPGRPATLDRLPRSLLKYDHIARSAIGTGLAAALRRDGDTEGLRWLDAVEAGEGVPAETIEQIAPRRIWILGLARRWADLEILVRSLRGGERTAKPDAVTPLEPLVARLLAVVCFEADRRIAGDTIEMLGQIAMTDLVARGEVGHVLDLAQRYGTAPLGDQGFIVHYVRGMQLYDRAVTAHKAAGSDPDEPTADPALANKYRQAAGLLDASAGQGDAERFTVERAKALVAAGRALFRAADPVAAAERFSRAASISTDPSVGEEALWLAIVARDRAVRDGASAAAEAEPRLDELTTLYIRQFPQTERAASLLIRRAATGIDDEQAVGVLLGVAPESPVYLPARRQAARILYRMFRAQRDRAGLPFAAARFVKIGEEVLAADRRAALGLGQAESREAVDRVVLLTRQLLDAILSVPTPDVARAESAIETMLAVVAQTRVDISKHDGELRFRRFQILLAKDDTAAAEGMADAMRSSGDRLADAADRVLFQRAVLRWKRAGGGASDLVSPVDPAVIAAGASVVRLGSRLIDRMGSGAGALSDPAVQTVYRQVAQAAAEAWRAGDDTSARDLAIRLDKALLDAFPGTADCLERLAILGEAAGDAKIALECWRTLASGLSAGSTAWFRAKYETARLLADADPGTALDVLSQVLVLYPEGGPEPWRGRLRALFDRLKAAAPVAAPPTGPGSSPGQGGGP